MPLMNYNQLAAHLGVSVQTLYNWQSTGKPMPPSCQVGRLRRFRPDDVDAWLSLQSSPGVPPHAPILPAVHARKRGRPTKVEQLARQAPSLAPG